MKKLLFLPALFPFMILCNGQEKTVHQYPIKNDADFYFENSKNKWVQNNENKAWQKRGDFAVLSIGFGRGDCCGSVPGAEQITYKMVNDTVFYNLNIIRDPTCRTEIGLCGNAIDFVINTKNHIYQKFVFIKVADHE